MWTWCLQINNEKMKEPVSSQYFKKLFELVVLCMKIDLWKANIGVKK